MEPMRGEDQWEETGKPRVKPPDFKKLAGRPKLNRRKARDEPKKLGKLSKKGVVLKCSICKVPSHNKRGCPTNTEVYQ